MDVLDDGKRAFLRSILDTSPEPAIISVNGAYYYHVQKGYLCTDHVKDGHAWVMITDKGRAAIETRPLPQFNIGEWVHFTIGFDTHNYDGTRFCARVIYPTSVVNGWNYEIRYKGIVLRRSETRLTPCTCKRGDTDELHGRD